MVGRYSLNPSLRDGPVPNKSKQQAGIEHHHDREDAVGGERGGQAKFDEHPGQSERDDQGIESHADPPERFRVHPTIEIAPERNSQQDAGGDIRNDLHAVGAVVSNEIVGDSSEDRFSHSNDVQRGPEILFGIPLDY
jgi:hypothetical protein